MDRSTDLNTAEEAMAGWNYTAAISFGGGSITR